MRRAGFHRLKDYNKAAPSTVKVAAEFHSFKGLYLCLHRSHAWGIFIGVARFELTTFCSQSRRSTRLSYTPHSSIRLVFVLASVSSNGALGLGLSRSKVSLPDV